MAKTSRRLATFAAAMLVVAAGAWAAPVVGNPGFETPPFPGWPGYSDWIPDWIGAGGVNPTDVGDAPFLNGLTAPEGTHVGFQQTSGTLSQWVTGLVVGQEYVLSYMENERGVASNSAARLQIDIDGQTIVPAHTVTRMAEFRQVISAPFTATSDTQFLEVIHPGGGYGDNSALFDDFQIASAGIVNASFEDGPVNPYPGYGPINGWSSSGGRGTNDAAGPFTNGLPIPDGDWIGFIQGSGRVTQTVGGFEPGKQYVLQYFENERTGADRVARLQIDLGGQTIVPAHDVTRTPEFRTVVSAPFTATSFIHDLEVIHPGGGTGDNTALFDNILITDASVPFVKNASFEGGPVHPWPGYGRINSWNSSGGEGLNDSTGPFVNGLPIPDGGWVAFIQGSGSVSQTVVGLEPGKGYIVQYSENERTGADRVARLQVNLDGETVVPVHDVTRTSRFVQVAGTPFTATATSALLEIIHPGGGTGDNTALFDNFIITEAGVPYIKNAGFEEAPYAYGGGGNYYSDIPGWGDPVGNPAGVATRSPDRTATWLGGAQPPEGDQVGFIQGGGTIEQLVVGLEPGKDYILQYSENERGGTWDGPPMARLEVKLGGQAVVPAHDLFQTTEFQQVVGEVYTATAHSALLEVTHPGGGTGDNTALFDNFIITEAGVPFIKNPSFEEGQENAYPGYGTIYGWTRTHTTGNSGTNDATGPFLSGLSIPDGETIGFIQREGSVAQQVVGLEPGETYVLQYLENERGYAAGGVAPVAQLQVNLGGQTVVPAHDVTRTGGFRQVVGSPFAATATSALLEVVHPGGGAGDNTALFDDFIITRVGEPVIYNPSFEKGPVNPYPGYGPINGWTRTHPPGNSGTNDAAGPFTNGLPIPDGDWIGFIQGGGSVSETVVGLIPGKKYTIQYFENERGYAGGGTPVARLQVDADGQTIVAPHDITRTDRFRRVVSAPFTASAVAALLEVIHPGGSGDNTALFDQFSISRAVPVVGNGGFETPALGPGGYQYRPPGAGWTFIGGSGVNHNRGGFQGGASDDAPEGSQIAFLQRGSPANPTIIEQVISGFEPGAWYSLSWAQKNRTNYGGVNDLIVELIDPQNYVLTLFQDDSVDNALWEYMTSASFSAWTDTYTLRFSTTNPDPLSGDNTTLIDDVHFNFELEIPEPTTLALLALGGLGLLVRRRRR